MSTVAKYEPTTRELAFLETVESPRYDRQTINGLKPFFEDRVSDDLKNLYTSSELDALRVLQGTERDVESRMPVKVTAHYAELARTSPAIQAIVKARPDETQDLAGAEDPGFQMDYSPVEGLLHKYEMGLMYVISTCSAHCRFCYREELISRKEIKRQDGTVAKKGLAQVDEVTAYIRAHNKKVEDNGGRHPESGREKLREILLSGGDSMVLSNRKLAVWMSALAESGIESIRIGTKEMAFYPDRFDDAFLAMLDEFHRIYPEVGLRLMLHRMRSNLFLAQLPL